MKTRRKKPAYRKPAFWVKSLLVVAILCAGIYLWRGIFASSPRFLYSIISVNQEPIKLPAGKALTLRPNDKIKILEISTNILFNKDVRSVADGLDVTALLYDEMKISELLPNQEIFDHYSFRILIKRRNKELGYMDWKVQPYAEDWLDEADRIKKRKERLAILVDEIQYWLDNQTDKTLEVIELFY